MLVVYIGQGLSNVCRAAKGADSLSKCLEARDATDPPDSNDDTVDTFKEIDGKRAIVLLSSYLGPSSLPLLPSARTGKLYPRQKGKKE